MYCHIEGARRVRGGATLGPDTASPKSFGEETGRGTETVEPPEVGSVIKVVYLDHLLHRNCQSSGLEPARLETVGWLEAINPHFIRIVWERFRESDLVVNAKSPSTGLTIVRETIFELKRLD